VKTLIVFQGQKAKKIIVKTFYTMDFAKKIVLKLNLLMMKLMLE
jgi:hypothetical protein